MDHQLMMSTLEKIAERDLDITAAFYDKLFFTAPGAEEVFDGTPRNQRGTMLTKVVEMVTDYADGRYDMNEFYELDIPMHEELGVTVPMYQGLFQALLTTFREQLGEHWTAEEQAAWQRQFDRLLKEISDQSESQGSMH